MKQRGKSVMQGSPFQLNAPGGHSGRYQGATTRGSYAVHSRQCESKCRDPEMKPIQAAQAHPVPGQQRAGRKADESEATKRKSMWGLVG